MKKILVFLNIIFFLIGCNEQTKTELIIEPTTILRPGIDTVEVGETWVNAGALLIVGDESFTMNTMDLVDINTIGFYDILYTVVYEEIDYFITRRVAVVEKKSFKAEILPGVDTLLVGETWIDAGVNAPFGSEITINSEVDTSKPGTYIVEYIISHEGKEVVLYRYVNVI